jgi:hypothetical protein
MVSTSNHWPEKERLSILTAVVLLAYALTRLLNLPVHQVALSFLGIRLAFELRFGAILSFLAAGLVAAGMNWMLQSHPAWGKNRAVEALEHLFLPALTALITGLALGTLARPWLWWLGFGVGALLMVLVLLAEYIVTDKNDARYPVASVLLTALTFVFYFILNVALRAANARLFLLVPALFLGSGLTALRVFHLRLGVWSWAQAFVVALICVQIGAAFHYWPLTPVQFGLALLSPAYALTDFVAALTEGESLRRALVAPMILLGVFWGLAIWFH